MKNRGGYRSGKAPRGRSDVIQRLVKRRGPLPIVGSSVATRFRLCPPLHAAIREPASAATWESSGCWIAPDNVRERQAHRREVYVDHRSTAQVHPSSRRSDDALPIVC